MEKVMTATELKKSLKFLSQKELIDLVYRLYKNDDKNKQIFRVSDGATVIISRRRSAKSYGARTNSCKIWR